MILVYDAHIKVALEMFKKKLTLKSAWKWSIFFFSSFFCIFVKGVWKNSWGHFGGFLTLFSAFFHQFLWSLIFFLKTVIIIPKTENFELECGWKSEFFRFSFICKECLANLLVTFCRSCTGLGQVLFSNVFMTSFCAGQKFWDLDSA